MDPTPFFRFARERHAIWHRRQQGQIAPWTDDPILHRYRFTNVYRELDRVTIWLRENVRERLPEDQHLLATILFRWFNRPETGQVLFRMLGDHGEPAGSVTTLWEQIWRDIHRDGDFVQHSLDALALHARPPFVTGAYIIKTPDGYKKEHGVLQCFEWLVMGKRKTGLPQNSDWREINRQMLEGVSTLEGVWGWLRTHRFMGDFMAYEVVSDLRHTVLSGASDIMTWANPGPGAMRGLNRLHGRDKNHSQPKHTFICEMRQLLEASQSTEHWPNTDEFPPLEMREIEHTLCEFDKYERVRLGEGRPRGVYPHGES